MENTLRLAQRKALPEALRVLLTDLPRQSWETHPKFGGLVQFWLERHLMFRQLVDVLESDAQQAVDRALDPQAHRARVSRFAGMLVQQLHGHHQIEDHQYFPQLVTLDKRLQRGFDILDSDHHDLDDLLSRFVTQANGLLQGGEPGAFLTGVEDFKPFLNRHLVDEEELVVPVILTHW